MTADKAIFNLVEYDTTGNDGHWDDGIIQNIENCGTMVWKGAVPGIISGYAGMSLLSSSKACPSRLADLPSSNLQGAHPTLTSQEQ